MVVELQKKLQKLKNNGKKILIPYITAGYPSLLVTEKLILDLEANGADLIELGIPFSDPLADGPVIQQASEVALKNGANLKNILSLVSKIREKTKIPIVFMSYYNPIYNYGVEDFVKYASNCGVNGVIVPDLPPEEGEVLIKSAKNNNFAVIFLFSPTSPEKRIKLIMEKSTGFVYYVSLTGVTGVREKMADSIKSQIDMARKYTSKPIAVGFGISTPQQAKEACVFADGVIVGSAIIKKITENINQNTDDLAKSVGSFIKDLKNAI